METTDKSIEVLNDLIEINNDRVAGFEKAITDLEEPNMDLKAIFEKLAGQKAVKTQSALNRCRAIKTVVRLKQVAALPVLYTVPG